MVSAVLFDFDGVVVQSERLHMKTFLELLAPYGVKVSEERWYREFAGTGSRSIFERLVEEFRIDSSVDELVERRKKLYERCVRSGALKETPGVRDFLEALQAEGIKTAIVSGSHRTNVAAALSFFGLGRYFDLIVSGDESPSRKPEPGPFLHAAKKLGVRPEDCLVIEDSVAGCEAARRAGMNLAVMRSPALPFVGKYDKLIDDFRGLDVSWLSSGRR
jgi:HAD superfamily hydrolase (TIGR01509 family)